MPSWPETWLLIGSWSWGGGGWRDWPLWVPETGGGFVQVREQKGGQHRMEGGKGQQLHVPQGQREVLERFRWLDLGDLILGWSLLWEESFGSCLRRAATQPVPLLRPPSQSLRQALWPPCQAQHLPGPGKEPSSRVHTSVWLQPLCSRHGGVKQHRRIIWHFCSQKSVVGRGSQGWNPESAGPCSSLEAQ